MSLNDTSQVGLVNFFPMVRRLLRSLKRRVTPCHRPLVASTSTFGAGSPRSSLTCAWFEVFFFWFFVHSVATNLTLRGNKSEQLKLFVMYVLFIYVQMYIIHICPMMCALEKKLITVSYCIHVGPVRCEFLLFPNLAAPCGRSRRCHWCLPRRCTKP